jgi:phosphomevalonate kinase
MTRGWTATAPGKLVLFGEYVVLEGAPALVLAADRRAQAHYAPHSDGRSALYRIAAKGIGLSLVLEVKDGLLVPAGGAQMPERLQLVTRVLQDVFTESAGRLVPGVLTLDTEAFYHQGTKLGLGSSAAVTVAAWHALRAVAQLPPMGPQSSIAVVRALHNASQGGHGSGVDLAASTLGGLVRYQLGSTETPSVEVTGVLSATAARPLGDLHILPVWTGQAAETGPLLTAFAALKAQDAARYWHVCEDMALVSRAACEFWALGETTPLMPLVTRAMAALEHLGKALGLDLVTDVHRQAAAAAQDAGAVYKPSGAGGGDFGLVVAQSSRTLQRASRALVALGLVPMPMALSARGVTVHAGAAS